MDLKHIIQIYIGLAILALAGLIYVGYRSTGLIMFSWFEYLNIDVTAFRADNSDVPAFVLYSLPDGLWLCSGILIIMALWKNQVSIESLICAGSMPVVAIGWEMLQLLNIKSGVFDFNDLLSEALGVVIAVIIIMLIESKVKINQFINQKQLV